MDRLLWTPYVYSRVRAREGFRSCGKPIERGSRSKVIALFDASSGKAQGEVRVAPGVKFLSAGGGWVVYGEGRSIRGFKARVRAVRLHFRARRIPYAVSAAGRRVAWFENHRGRGQILAFTLPH